MPRVYNKKKFNLGRDYHCGRCGRKIEPGEQYYSWSFRYGGTQVRCSDHYPRQSELTQSKMGEVYAAIEGAEETLESAETIAEMREAIEVVAEQVQATAEEYREADEAFGGQGATESAERADELEGWVSELEDFDPDEPDDPEEFDEDSERINLCQELYGIDEPSELEDDQDKSDLEEALKVRRSEWEEEQEEDAAGQLAEARETAQELLNSCPL